MDKYSAEAFGAEEPPSLRGGDGSMEGFRLQRLVAQPEVVDKIKAAGAELDDFVVPKQLSFVHLHMITRD